MPGQEDDKKIQTNSFLSMPYLIQVETTSGLSNKKEIKYECINSDLNVPILYNTEEK